MVGPTLEILQEKLIEKFDADYWNKRARIYTILLENKKLSGEIIQRNDPEDREFLLTELNATKIHCCETLMRHIIIAKFDHSPLIPLMSLTQRRYAEEIKKMTDNFELFFKGNSEKYFKKYFFPLNDEEKSKESAAFMKKCVKKILEELSDKSVYNVYKHGFYGTVSIQDNAKMIHTSKSTGKVTEYKIGHLISSYNLIKKNTKGGGDHVILFQDNAIEVMRDKQIIDLVSKFISNYYNFLRIHSKKSTKGSIWEFRDNDDYVNSVFKFESFWKKVNIDFPIEIPSNIKKYFNIKK